VQTKRYPLKWQTMGRPPASSSQQKGNSKDASEQKHSEGKFGQGKRKYGMDYICQTKSTSQKLD